MSPWLRSLSQFVVLTGGLASTACVDLTGAVGARFIEQEEKRFAVTGKPDVAVKTFDGSIEIRGWDRPEVRVVVEKYGPDKQATSRIQVGSEQRDNRVTVEAGFPPGSSGFLHWHLSTYVKMIVSVPSASNVVAKSGDGSLSVSQVTGVLDLRSGDGSIRGQDVSGSVKARTGDGSIALNIVDGSADLDTGDGSVKLEGQLKRVRVRTGDGSVDVRAAAGSRPEEDWDIQTGDGHVRLEVRDGFAGDLDAHTNDGRIHLDGIEVSNITGEIGRGALRGTLGGGGRAVRVRTGDGSITIRKF